MTLSAVPIAAGHGESDEEAHVPEPTGSLSLAERAAAAYGAVPGIVAVAVAGSFETGMFDQQSDIDLYVYAEAIPGLATRREIAARSADRTETGNDAWEPGDEWIDAESGVHVDVMFRTPGWIEDQLERVLVRHEASLGYSTCLWHNVLHSRPLFDPAGWYRDLQASATTPYPAELKRAIVAKNQPLLRDALSSFLHQVDLAVARSDAIAVQHRITALLASCFDVLFAVNELPHPGEKRLLRYATTRCTKLPTQFEERINDVLAVAAYPVNPAVVASLDILLDALDDLLRAEGLLPPSPRNPDGQPQAG